MLRCLHIAMSVLFVVVVSAAILFVAYFITYLALGSRSLSPGMDFRIFKHEWQEHIFRPAARLESFIRQKPVDTADKAD